MEKNSKNKLLYFSLLLTIIAIILLICYIFIEKTNYNEKVTELENNINMMQNTIENLEKINAITNTNKDSQLEDIVLEDYFGIENSDAIYKFNKNGTVEFSGNSSTMEGTYKTINKNEIQINFNKETSYEDDIYNANIKNINITAKCTVIDKNNLYIEYEYEGIKYKHNIVKIEKN